MVRVEHNGKSYEIPGVLDELTPDQYKGYLFLAVMLRRGIIDEMGFKAKLLAELMGLGVDITDFKPDVAEATESALAIFNAARPMSMFMLRIATFYIFVEVLLVIYAGALRGAGDTVTSLHGCCTRLLRTRRTLRFPRWWLYTR